MCCTAACTADPLLVCLAHHGRSTGAVLQGRSVHCQGVCRVSTAKGGVRASASAVHADSALCMLCNSESKMDEFACRLSMWHHVYDGEQSSLLKE